jgi:hypothetical protein
MIAAAQSIEMIGRDVADGPFHGDVGDTVDYVGLRHSGE